MTMMTTPRYHNPWQWQILPDVMERWFEVYDDDTPATPTKGQLRHSKGFPESNGFRPTFELEVTGVER